MFARITLSGEELALYQKIYDAIRPQALVLIVNSENLNFVARDADLELLLSRMLGMKSRREFFSLG